MLTESAYRNGLAASQSVDRGAQRERGQFMTPQAIATFMARHAVSTLDARTIRLLEPAAGSGVLIAAAVEALLTASCRPLRVEILAFELDAAMLPLLHATCQRLKAQGTVVGVEIVYVLKNEDFLLSSLALAGEVVADLVIANPPYFKLGGIDARAQAHAYALHGQPNIYGLFMAACSRLVRPGGSYCFITPRSWTNGPYFRAVRQCLFDRLAPTRLHVFGSRTESFRDDDVLQETMIIWARAGTSHGVAVTESVGTNDLNELPERVMPTSALRERGEAGFAIGPPGHELPASWTETLGTLGLAVSTGPTVAFRSGEHLRSAPDSMTVPLLWMQHVRRNGVSWPVGHEREHIRVNSSTSWMLLPNHPMVLLRRFSPKEDVRRMTAAAYLGNLDCSHLGVENHLNYVHRKGGTLDRTEAIGLTAMLGCQRVERYFRAWSGNTQINATDLRRLSLPNWQVIRSIGRAMAGVPWSLEAVDATVERVCGDAVVEQLAA